jgi:hypothetical protein
MNRTQENRGLLFVSYQSEVADGFQQVQKVIIYPIHAFSFSVLNQKDAKNACNFFLEFRHGAIAPTFHRNL